MSEHTNFQNLGLSDSILKGIYTYGFKDPSKIQIKGIKAILSKKDSIIQSQSGTGKTATYLLSILNMVDINKKTPQAIIISPTRELAIQINDVAENLAKYTNINVSLTIGGSDFKTNINDIKKSQIIIATIGRINHVYQYFKNTKSKTLNSVNMLIFDEADNILENDITDEIQSILSNQNENCQKILISATLTKNVFNYAEKYMNSPHKILLKREEIAVDLISQFYVDSEIEENKFDVMMDLYSMISTTQAIIFCNTIRKLNWLEKELEKNNFTITCIHGQMSQEERNEVVKDFRSGKTRLLLTTDLLARGIDIPQVNLVINYDLPLNKETYIHRIGRCGRFGKKGVSISLVNFQDYNDKKHFKFLKNHYKIKINEMPNDINKYI